MENESPLGLRHMISFFSMILGRLAPNFTDLTRFLSNLMARKSLSEVNLRIFNLVSIGTGLLEPCS